MATVQLSDGHNPLVYAQGAQEAQIELNRFISSGVAVIDPTISGMASNGGNIGELPFFKALGTEEPNYSNDDPNVASIPANITSGEQKWRLASQNKSWSVMDLSKELLLGDPAGAITNRIGQYWATNNERRVIKTTMGMLADNIANDSSDMLLTVATDAAGAITDAERISADVVIDTVQTMGDHGESLKAMAMHSVIYRKLQKLNLIEFIPAASGAIDIPTYQGKRVIVDDSLVGVAGSNRITYTTVFFADGSIALGEGSVNMPSEVIRLPDAGNGGGEERIYSRRSDIIHPYGFSFESASVAGQSATQAELGNAANWDRVKERKNVGFAFLQTNG